METNKLTQKGIESRIRAGKPGHWPDGGGLQFVVLGPGSGVWRYRFRLDGKQQMISLGAYHPKDNGLASAREKLRAAKLLVQRGKNPAHERRAEREEHARLREQGRRQGVTFAEMFESEWSSPSTSRASTRSGHRSRYRTYFEDTIGKDPIGQLTEKRLRLLIANAKPSQQDHLRCDLNRVFTYARRHGHIDHNPVRDIDEKSTYRSKKRSGYADDELRRFFVGLREFADVQGVNGVGLLLIAYAVPRANELAHAEWSRIDLAKGTWFMPGDYMKEGLDHTFVLSRVAQAAFARIPKQANSNWVFPREDRKGPRSPKGFQDAMRRIGIRSGATPHLFRHTFLTWVRDNHPERMMEAETQLAHAQPVIQGTYARGNQIEKRKELMELWSDYLEGLR